MGLDAADEDAIVGLIHKTFDCLPNKFKPRNGEWTTLSAIAIVHSCGELDVLSLATGVKCLPMKAIRKADGIILHDCHAESVAIRALNRFLVNECHMLASNSGAKSTVIERREILSPGDRPYTIREDIKFIMYCSEAPCGDASMEIVMELQEDDTPWSNGTNLEEGTDVLLGRGFFDQLGRVRRKPARADSPITLSKSCSDKIALKQCTSLLAGVTTLLLLPDHAYIDTLIIPASQYRYKACLRAFRAPGRMQPLSGRNWPGAYAFTPFKITTTDIEFVYSRKIKNDACQRSSDVGDKGTLKGSNITAMWTAPSPMAGSAKLEGISPAQGPLFQNQPEILVNGRMQGWKEADPRGASRTSRKKIWEAVTEVLSILSIPAPSASTYEALKLSDAFAERRQVKAEVTTEALKGWTPNVMDSFSL